MKLIDGVDYIIDEKTKLMILTKEYLKKRGYCCGNKCTNCCYYPKHLKGNTCLQKEMDDSFDSNIRQCIR